MDDNSDAMSRYNLTSDPDWYLSRWSYFISLPIEAQSGGGSEEALFKRFKGWERLRNVQLSKIEAFYI